MSIPEPAKTQQRIIYAATELFSTLGYGGVSTRDIARVASVNESSIYRYYPHKRELFIAALEAELSKVRLRSDLITKLHAAQDARAAMLALLQVIIDAVMQQRSLIRLVHFSVLEFGDDLDDIYRRHMGQILQDAGEYLARWPEFVETPRFDLRITVIAFVATLVALKDFYPVFAGDRLSDKSIDEAAHFCADLWHAALAGTHLNPAHTTLPLTVSSQPV